MSNYSRNRRNTSRRRTYGGSTNRNRSRSKSKSKSIDPARFIKTATQTAIVDYTPKNSFSDFDFEPLLHDNLKEKGFTRPTQIQDQAIPLLMQGRDVVGIANTGTGKTGAFLLPLINRTLIDNSHKSLVIAPTRELALQIQQEAQEFAKGGRLKTQLIIGGVPMRPQFQGLNHNPQLVIGTPGRMKDHIERGSLKLNDFNVIVLDEVDRMLDMGFINDIRMILSKTGDNRQSMFFSATLSPTIENLIQQFANDPTKIMARTAETSDNVDQSVLHYNQNSDKLEKLHDLLNFEVVEKTLIFCRTKRGSDRLSRELVGRGFSSDVMHGDKSQGQRQRALRKFRDGHVDILVATDVAARGIDVDGITHVINYDVPESYEDYTHRIGRTGRVGNVGYAVTFVTD